MKYFFILSIGRSGTQFLANLLNSGKNVLVNHEPAKIDYHLLPLAYYYPNSNLLDSLLNRRFEEVLSDVKGATIYGEVNSLLRYHIDWLKKRFDPVFIHLVRSGKSFVSSAYRRKLYTGFDSHMQIIPKNNDEFSGAWEDFDRFQKICWYWKHTNDYLLQKIDDFVRFEDIISNYDCINEKIFRKIGANISFKQWNQARKVPINSSNNRNIKRIVNKLVHFNKRNNYAKTPQELIWTENIYEKYIDICGETMNKLGYKR